MLIEEASIEDIFAELRKRVANSMLQGVAVIVNNSMPEQRCWFGWMGDTAPLYVTAHKMAADMLDFIRKEDGELRVTLNSDEESR